MKEPAGPRDGKRLLVVARAGRPHGLDGRIQLHPFNPDGDILDVVRNIVLRTHDGVERDYRVLDARRGPRQAWLVSLEGVHTRTEARTLTGALVLVRREQFPPLPEGQWYYVDLEGLGVVDPMGQRIGTVARVIGYPTIDCLVVEGHQWVREVPLQPPWVVDVRVADGVVLVGDLSDVPVLSRPP
ncbi:MAG: ribosome maturation factor RimM [Myxococcota bacterium]|nr:ribosome maturation factor RimM [Myxococcota bacterium]MDW8360873.1 ribosome maturation factor RimM [Myxococcales bacterium]